MGQLLQGSARTTEQCVEQYKTVREHSAISKTLWPEAKDGGEVQEEGSCLRCVDGTEEPALQRTEH